MLQLCEEGATWYSEALCRSKNVRYREIDLLTSAFTVQDDELLREGGEAVIFTKSSCASLVILTCRAFPSVRKRIGELDMTSKTCYMHLINL